MRFKIQPLSWFKRRWPTEVEPKVTEFEVTEFEKIDKSYCKLFVRLDNGETYNLSARVALSVTHVVGKSPIENGWSVQGLNPDGLNVLLKLEED